MRERNEIILADLVAAGAERGPDFDVVTFGGGSLEQHPRNVPTSMLAGFAR
jgi:hypothetical protein